MTSASAAYPLVGHQPISNFLIPDTVQSHKLGTIMGYSDPHFGGGEAIYLQAPASVALSVGSCVTYSLANAFVSSLVVNDNSNAGSPVAFAINAVASSASAQYYWAAISGSFPAHAASDVAAGAGVGIAGTGQVGALAAGKALGNIGSVGAFATTVAKTNTQVTNGSKVLKVTNTDGWWVGLTVSGTGIPASSEITVIDSDNRTVTMSETATASGVVTVTGTFTDRILVQFNRPYAMVITAVA